MILTKKFLLMMVLMFFIWQTDSEAQVKINSESINKLNGTHDLSLPDWGPYTKRYIGVSHIPNKEMGIRFDLSIFPGFYRRKVAVPNVLFENEYHPWEASPNLEYFSFRHELEWKDQVYTDISYSKINDKARLIRIDCVNNTINNQNIALHFMAFLNFPPIKEYSIATPIYPGIINLPKDAKWIDALDYQTFNFSKQRPQDDLVYDGKMRGEVRADGFVNGSGIGDGFGIEKNDNVSYRIKLEKSYSDASLMIRYKIKKSSELGIKLSGIVNKEVKLKGVNDFDSEVIKIGQLKSGDYELNIASNGGSEIEFDGFAISESNLIEKITVDRKEWNPVPTIIDGPVANSIILKYDDIDIYYGLLWDYDMFEIRQWYNQDLSSYFKQMVNEHVRMIFNGEGDGHFTNVFLKPIDIKPNSTKILYSVICSGTKSEVEKCLSDMNNSKTKFESIYETAKNHVVDLKPNPDGEKYKFSIEKMNATLACNVVYPVYSQREYIRHSAPGRWWDCLYTWDSGFIGLGLLETDVWRAVENLNAYVQEPGAQSAFIHHGSPVPVQHYLFFEMWNETQSTELLEYFYPRLKQFHEFLAGRLGSSTTRVLKSNLLKTWDYFYNSGGWDDYPPQKYTHLNSLQSYVTPVINTSQAIRTAKILRMAATYLGKTSDVKEYDNDIKMFSDAIQKYSWDEATGYFGYVVHDKNGEPTNILKYKDGVNFNMGLDGAYPLVAGITTEAQKERILNSLKSKGKIWSDIGLSAVDQSAPYYRIDGYWNGTVWMAHQWFFWKTMLDYGESEFAFKIAKTALDLWKNEVEASYNCMEHFLIKTGRGAGWHEFGGLSAPVINWFSAYYRPGNFNAGFDTWIENKKFNESFTELSVDLSFMQSNSPLVSVIACMNYNYEYIVKWNGNILDYKSVAQGTLSIDIPIKNNDKGRLEIVRKLSH